ncbi:MAG: hypothetical protein C3F14_00145 [Deltaproteobacteria bacterium]|nr:MAG: hypothetical protein C3F14_00145 [Deltaproteobacteria bacterium]
MDNRPIQCQVCGKEKKFAESMPAEMVRDSIVRIILRDVPGWKPDGYICRDDLDRYRARLVSEVLESGVAEAGSIEAMVAKSIAEQEMVSRNVNEEFNLQVSFGQRLADRIASFGGSWPFIILFVVVLIAWIAFNTMVIMKKPFDPYPYILLNLVLSCIAALQAPVIMMSQNRQEEKDRVRAEHDYRVNLKAEFEIRSLHEKIDHMLVHQWQRLMEIQQVQTDLLSELHSPKNGP